jgi:hypothetical protein
MDWPCIVIILGVVAATMLGWRVCAGSFRDSDFRRRPRRLNTAERPYREASYYRTSGALPRWRD